MRSLWKSLVSKKLDRNRNMTTSHFQDNKDETVKATLVGVFTKAKFALFHTSRTAGSLNEDADKGVIIRNQIFN